jgi:hypothetical protein
LAYKSNSPAFISHKSIRDPLKMHFVIASAAFSTEHSRMGLSWRLYLAPPSFRRRFGSGGVLFSPQARLGVYPGDYPLLSSKKNLSHPQKHKFGIDFLSLIVYNTPVRGNEFFGLGE